MIRKRTERGPFANSQAVLFFCLIKTGVRSVRNWVERLVSCGIPERMAQQIVDFFWKNRRTVELIAYVRMTEEATGK